MTLEHHGRLKYRMSILQFNMNALADMRCRTFLLLLLYLPFELFLLSSSCFFLCSSRFRPLNNSATDLLSFPPTLSPFAPSYLLNRLQLRKKRTNKLVDPKHGKNLSWRHFPLQKLLHGPLSLDGRSFNLLTEMT